MANVLDCIDGFDTYATAQLLTNGWTNTGGSINTTGGRRGGGAMTNSNSSGHQLKTNYQTVLWGFAYFVSASPAAGFTIATFTDGGTAQFDLRTNDAVGGLKFTRNGTLVGSATASGLLTAGIWHYLEFRVTFGISTAGTAELKLDGTSVILASGVNTSNTTNAFANGISFANLNTQLVDDLYVFGGNSGTVPSYIGDVAVKPLYPASDGTYTAWTPNSGTAHFSRVNEAQPDEDTSYVSTSGVGNIDSYHLGTLGAGTVFGIQQNFRHRVDDASTHTLAGMQRIGGVDFVNAAVATNSTYNTTRQIVELNPATGVAWTVADINGAEFGVKLVS